MIGMRRIKGKITAFMAVLVMVSMLVSLPGPVSYAAPENTEDKEAQAASESSNAAAADNRHDAVSQEAYKEFGLPAGTIEEYTSDEHPLENYEPAPKSWLYMSYMNKTSKNKGQFAVLDTMKALTEKNATLTDKNQKVTGNLDASPIVPYTDNAAASGSGSRIVGKNAVALADGMNDSTIVEMNLYYRETGTFSKTYESGFFFQTMKRQKNGAYLPLTSQNYDIKGGTAFKKLGSRAAAALTAMTAVDLDGDGVDELAVYTPYFTGPSITIFKQKSERDRMTLEKLGEIPLKDLNTDSDAWQFDQGYGGENFPVVGLSTSSLAGAKEHLIITACCPASVANHSNVSALAIYSMDGGTLKKEYTADMEFVELIKGIPTPYVYRYASAVQADVDGDGQDEIVLAGYNNGRDGYYLNMLTYDKGKYKKVNNTAFKISVPGDTSDITARQYFGMSEAVTLQAAKLNEKDDSDYIFLAGHVLKFKQGNKGNSLEDGSFDVVKSMDLSANKWGDFHFVSSAAVGRFAKDKGGSEQIAVVWQSYSKKDDVTMNISWLWADGTSVKQYNTNEKYLYERGALGYGSSIILCPVSDVNSAAYYQYEGKDFGWSAPQALVAIPAMPYWGELGAGGTPTVSFSVSRERTTGGGVDVSLQGGFMIGVDALGGAGLLGNGGGVGAGFDLEGLIGLAYEFSQTHTKGQERTITADAGRDSAVILSIPIVTYHYKRYLPESKVTQQALDKIIKETGVPPYYGDDPSKLIKAGDVIPAGWYSADTVIQFDEVYSSMYVDDYNKLCDKYSTASIPIEKIDMSELYSSDYRKGDPSTYPSKKEEIKSIGSKSAVVGPMAVKSNGGTVEMAFTQESALTSDFAFHLSVDGDIYGQAKGKFCLFVNLEGEIKVGGAGAFDVQAGNVSVTTKGEGIRAQLAGPPTEKDFYSYEASLVAWNAAWGKDKKDTLLMVGPLADARKDIPLPPENPYVYEAGTDMALLGWDNSADNGLRQAEKYRVYQDTGGSNKTLVGEADRKENLFVVSGLTPGKEYTFYFTGVGAAPDSLESEYSVPLKVTTKSTDSQIHIPADQPEDAYVKVGEGAVFSVQNLTPPEGYELCYQWYEYIPNADKHMGEWQKKENQTSDTLTIDNVTAEMDNNKYRLEVQLRKKVSIGNAVTEETVYSRAASLYIGDDSRPSCEITSLTRDKGGTDERELKPLKGTYYIAAGQMDKPVSIEASVKEKGGGAVTSGTVTFMYRKDGGTPQPLGASPLSLSSSGTAGTTWTPSEAGRYEFAAVYESDGGTQLVMSAPSVVSAGNLKDSFYLVRYVTDGGTKPPENPYGISRTAGSIPLADASRDYYIFQGWYTKASGEGTKIEELNPEQIARELGGNGIVYTLYAYWEPIQYSIVYEHGHVTGTVQNPNPDSYTIQQYYDLKDPVLPGYEFKGWYKEASYITKVSSLPLGGESKDAVGSSTSSTLYAKWEEQEYPIRYILNGFPLLTGPDTYKVTDLPLDLPNPEEPEAERWRMNQNVPVNNGDQGEKRYVYKEWKDTQGNTITAIPEGTTGEFIVEAGYEREFTAVYLNEMGGKMKSGWYHIYYLHASSSSLTTPAKDDIHKKGFIFDGWYGKYDSTTGEYKDKREYMSYDVKANNVMLYAKWVDDPNQVIVKYHLNYGGSTDYYLPADTYTVKGDTVDRPDDPERDGYTFTGWYLDKACTTEWDFGDKVPDDYENGTLVLYAGWEKNKGSDDTPGGGTVTPGNNGARPGAHTGGKNGGAGQAGARTGDTALPVMWGGIIMISAVVLFIILRRRKQDK